MDDTASGAWELAVRDRLIARDPSALSDLYDQFGSYVFGLAARVIGDRHAAEDVTQEVFLSLWERPAAFDPAEVSRAMSAEDLRVTFEMPEGNASATAYTCDFSYDYVKINAEYHT